MRKANIENLLSDKIKTSQLYLDSLTHRSASNKNNERLEFFGDAILGFFIAEFLYGKFPEDDDDYDTLGGFILNLVGEFPNKGTEVSYENLTFTVLEIKKRRIISIECIVQEDINKDIENLTSN